MRIDDRVLQEIKDKNNIVDVVRSYIGLSGGNGRFKTVCPFHNEKTPSFSVNENLQLFKCFGCNVGGDVIKFVQEYEKVEFIDAVEILAKRAGINIEKTQLSPAQQIAEDKARLIKVVNDEAYKFFQNQLSKTKEAKEYLIKRELKEDTIKEFAIGYADMYNSLTKLLQEKYSKEILIDGGLCVERNDKLVDKFRNRIMFPIIDRKGSVIGFGGRDLGTYGPKYLNSPENPAFHKKLNLYAIGIARTNVVNDSIVLAEGYMDVISLHQNGVKNSVASLGTAITKEQVSLIKTYAKKIIIAYDSDDAGVEATKRAIDLIHKENLEAFVVDLKDMKDPDEYAKKYGEESLKSMIDNARTALKYHLYLLYNEHNLAVPNQRDEFIKKSQELLKDYDARNIATKVEIEDAIVTIAKITKASVKSVGQGIYGKYFSYKQAEQRVEVVDKQRLNIPNIDPLKNIKDKENLLLEFISANHNYIGEVGIEDFFFDDSKMTYEAIVNGELVSNKATEIEDESQFFNLVDNVRKNTIEQKIKTLENKLEELGNSEEADFVLMEITKLSAMLKI